MPLRCCNNKNLFQKKCYFAFSVTSNRDFGKFLKIISQRVLLKLQTDTVLTQSLSNSYDELLMSAIFFSQNTTQRPEGAVQGCFVKGFSKNFTKTRAKHLYQNLYFYTAASPSSENILRSESNRVFSVKFAKFLIQFFERTNVKDFH